MIEPAVSIIGSGSAEAALAARALLGGNGVAHRLLDTDDDPVGRILRERTGLGVERPGRRLPGRLAARRAGRLRRAVPWPRDARVPRSPGRRAEPQRHEHPGAYAAGAGGALRRQRQLAHRAGAARWPADPAVAAGVRRGDRRRRAGRLDCRRLRGTPRVCAPSRSNAWPRADRQAPAPASRTTPASRRASAAPSSRAARTSRSCASAPNCSSARKSSARTRDQTATGARTQRRRPAELHGIPIVRVGLGLAEIEELSIKLAAPEVDKARAELALPSDPGGERLAAAPFLTTMPQELEDPAVTVPARTSRFRFEAGAGAEKLPDCWPGTKIRSCT